ncbi:MAG: hypothetical protein ACTHZ9_09990 [Leucobacter sp.]
MARRHGVFAEVQRQVKKQARANEQRQRAAAREHQAAVRRAEQARRASERAQATAQRAAEAERRQAQREALAAHVAAKQAEVEAMNAALEEQYEELDSILSATLDVDDFVDLEAFRVKVNHPPFDKEYLRHPVPLPPPIPDPAWPVRAQVQAPTRMFGRKKKLAEAQAAVEAKYAADYARWQWETNTLGSRREAQRQQHAAKEQARKQELARELARYEKECAERDRAARERNADLDEFISALDYRVPEAVQEYVGIVLANSVYPDFFPVDHVAEFDPSAAELSMRVSVPGPEHLPKVKAYRYTKASDAVTSSQLSQKAIKDRYSAIINAVALRSLHEVFEADRKKLIESISLKVGTNVVDPATGRRKDVLFVAVAVRRAVFDEIELSAVVPEQTLAYLGATVSKNPLALESVSSSGVRGAR